MRDEDLLQLRNSIQEISNTWFTNRRPNNSGGVGNTLEDLLGIPENNIPAPDFGEWELKSQRDNTSSLVTLFHTEPDPRSAHIISHILLPQFGWRHQEAGIRYPIDERSFRQTLYTRDYSSRGFKVDVDRNLQQVSISFCFARISVENAEWKNEVYTRTHGHTVLAVTPFWPFAVLEQKLRTKLQNVVFVTAETRRNRNEEAFRYNHIEIYMNPTIERLLTCLEEGQIAVDFDARTGHNHGTKFRINRAAIGNLFEQSIIV